MKTRAAITSLLLSGLFLVVYGTTNWIASGRSDAGTWYLEWELTAIPFVPLMIIPYLSIDLFFVASPFLCRDRRSLDVLASRIAFSILVAVAGPFLTRMNYTQAVFAGLIIGVGGFVGDVCISALKRDLHIKDSGTLLPGHGGILDRIDSLTYTAPLYFHYVYWLFLFHTHGAGGPFSR